MAPTLIDTRTPYEQWLQGDITPREFFNIVTGDLYEQEMAKNEAIAAYDNTKSQLAHLMSVMENTVGEAEMRDLKERLGLRGYTYQSVKPSERRNVKVASLMKLEKRIQAADPALWEAVLRCITVTQIDGGVRIGHVKGDKEGA